jgi:hypothetical protein
VLFFSWTTPYEYRRSGQKTVRRTDVRSASCIVGGFPSNVNYGLGLNWYAFLNQLSAEQNFFFVKMENSTFA